MLLVHDKGIDVVDLRPNSLKIIAKHSTKSGGNRSRPSKRKVNFRWMKFLSKHFSHMRKNIFLANGQNNCKRLLFLASIFRHLFCLLFFLSDPHLFAIYIFLTICCLSMTACVCFDVYVCGFCLKFVFMKPTSGIKVNATSRQRMFTPKKCMRRAKNKWVSFISYYSLIQFDYHVE